MRWFTSIISFISGLFSFLHDRKVAQGAVAAETIKQDNQELAAAKDAQNIRNTPTLLDDLPTDDEPHHNYD